MRSIGKISYCLRKAENSNYAQSRRSNFSGNQVEKKPLIII